jgi:hypothetical protein
LTAGASVRLAAKITFLRNRFSLPSKPKPRRFQPVRFENAVQHRPGEKRRELVWHTWNKTELLSIFRREKALRVKRREYPG